MLEFCMRKIVKEIFGDVVRARSVYVSDDCDLVA